MELLERGDAAGVRVAAVRSRTSRADLGLPSETLRKYVRQVEAERGRAAGSADERRSARRSRSCARENCELRRANEILKAASRVFRGRARSDTDRSERASSTSTAAASGSSRSAGPWACRRPPTTSAPPASARRARLEDERLLERIRELHAANYYAYGYRRMWKALLRAGEQVGRGRVERLMRSNGIQGAKRRGKPWRTTDARPAALRPPDLVQRDFTRRGPNELWVADFTYLRCWEGVVFFAS